MSRDLVNISLITTREQKAFVLGSGRVFVHNIGTIGNVSYYGY